MNKDNKDNNNKDKEPEYGALLYSCGHMIAQRKLNPDEYFLANLTACGNCPKCESGETKPEPEKIKEWYSFILLNVKRVTFG